jgi:hypothetical protein
MEDRSNINYLRRATGAIVCLAPVILLAASIAYGSAHSKITKPSGLVLVALGTIVATLNFYLSFIRGFLYRLRQGATQGYRHISGFPLIGTLLIVAGAIINFGSVPTAVLGLITIILDTGGAVWFLHCTWRDSSLWDE